MPLSNGIGLVVWMYLMILIGDVVRGQSAGPNAVVSVNGQTSLDCLTSLLAASSWTRTPDGSNSPLLIAVGCIVPGSNTAYYSTTLVGGNICRLTIANATMQQAGVYNCAAGSGGISYNSLVTVIDPVASLIVYNQSEVVENDQLNISCSMNYTGPVSPAPLLRPLPLWTSAGQSFASTKYYPSTNIVTLVATVTVKKPTVPTFQCNTGFEIIGSTSGYNLTAPQDNFSVGNTIPLDVQYYPTSTTITSTVSTTDKCVYKQESLTCAADANPPAQYEWLDLSNNVKTIGSVKSISSGGQYQCIAHNVIRSLRYNNTKIASEATCYSPYNLTMGGSNCANSSCSCPHKLIPVSLSCTADGYPKPTIHWWSDVPEMEDLGNNPTIEVIIDGNYNCTASNAYGGQPYIATASMSVTKCPVYCFAFFKELYICVIVIIFPIYFGLGGIFGVLFVICIWKTRKQETFLTRFPILRKMLPCMNNELPDRSTQTETGSPPPPPKATTESSTQTQTGSPPPPPKATTDCSIQTDIEPPKQPSTDRSTQTETAPTPMSTTDCSIQTDIETPPKTPIRKASPIDRSIQVDIGSPPPPPKATTDRSTQTEIVTLSQRCLWITLYIVMVIISGIVVIPTMLFMYSCCPTEQPDPGTEQNTKGPVAKDVTLLLVSCGSPGSKVGPDPGTEQSTNDAASAL